MKRETVGAMAILEVVGGDRAYRISFSCSQNRDEGTRNEQKSGPPFGTSFWDSQCRISFTRPKNRDKDSSYTQKVAKGNFDHWNVCNKKTRRQCKI